MIRVVLADDQPLVRAGLRTILTAEPDLEVVAEADDGDAAIAMCRDLAPDVVVMDVRMPGKDGIEATRILAADPHPPRVLILTTFDLDEYVYEALRAGASGFLLKTAAPRQLVAGIRDVVGGETLLAPAVTRRLIEDFVGRRPSADAAAQLDDLTSRELDVMRLLARGLSNSEIAAELYLGAATVKTHVVRILAKLGLRDRTQVVVLAYETGLVRPGDAASASP